MADTMEDAQDKYEQNAADALGELFSRYGLGSLAPKIVELVQEYGPENTNTILLQLQETEEYKARFVGNEYRKQAGYSVLSPAEYIALESSYREVMRRAGLPEGFYDQQGDFNQLVGRDISPAELASRAQAAVDWSLNIDETQKKALLAYGINHGDLAAYFLDYDRGLPLLQAKFDKALLAAYSCGNHQVDANEVKTAEQDARFSPLQAKAGFNAQPLLWGLAGAAVAALLIAMTVNLGSRTSSSDAAAPAKQANDEASKAPATRTETPVTPAPLDTIRFGPLTRQHLLQYEEWIKDAPRTHYFIQLLATDSTHTGEVEGFLARAIAVLEPAHIRVYRSSLSGRDRTGVIYGDFATREEAIAAMQSLPETIKAIQPFPRQVSKLR